MKMSNLENIISSILLLLFVICFHTCQNTSAITEAEALLKWKKSFSSSYKHHHLLSSLTSSVSVTETVNGSHQLVIQGYSLAKVIGIGKHIASENFTVGDYEWAIYFYPDGKKMEDNSSYVSVFIVLASEGTDYVRALFELTLIDQTGKGNHKVHTHFDRSLESGPYSLKYRGSMWGYKRFFRRDMLETSDYLKDDCLIISCRIGVVVSTMGLPSLKVPDSDIGAHFGVLLENQEGSDVVFHVSGETFHAHKLVLAARSPVLRSMFLDSNSDDRKELIVDDMQPKVFKAMLNFIYTDAVVEDELLATSSKAPSLLTDTMIAKLLAAADRYGLGRLKSICESYLFKEISVDSVSHILALADRYNAVELKDVCLHFASENLSAVVQSDGFKYLKENCLALQSEILKTIAGCEEDFGTKSQSSVWGAQTL